MARKQVIGKRKKRRYYSDVSQNINHMRYIRFYRAILDQILSDLKSRSHKKNYLKNKMQVRGYLGSSRNEVQAICHLAEIEYKEFMRIVRTIILYNM